MSQDKRADAQKSVRRPTPSTLRGPIQAPQTTHDLAVALGRDEEYVLKVTEHLASQNLIYRVEKNARGTAYKRRKPWAMTPDALAKYETVLGNQ